MILGVFCIGLSVFLFFLILSDLGDMGTGMNILMSVIGLLNLAYGVMRISEAKKENDGSNGKGAMKGIVLTIIVIALIYLGVSCVVGLQDDTTFHYLDTNGNDKADPGEYTWTEDGEGNETPGW